MLCFVRDTEDFYDLVAYCRAGKRPHGRRPPKRQRQYDVVFGPVAFGLQRLVLRDCDQVSFHSAKAFACLCRDPAMVYRRAAPEAGLLQRSEPMPQVDESNFDQVMTCAMRDEFWRRVRLSLKDYFNESEALADRYRTALDAAPVGELLLVYREDPLSVAADLAGRRDQMPRHVAAYRQRFPDGFGLFQ